MPQAAAIAVRQGMIVAVGPMSSRFIGPATKVIDAQGATIIPGLIDSHGHVRGLGTALETVDLRGIEIGKRDCRQGAGGRLKKAKPGEWILGRAWDQNLWAVKEFPTARFGYRGRAG